MMREWRVKKEERCRGFIIIIIMQTQRETSEGLTQLLNTKKDNCTRQTIRLVVLRLSKAKRKKESLTYYCAFFSNRHE
jgi:hypothetical protein